MLASLLLHTNVVPEGVPNINCDNPALVYLFGSDDGWVRFQVATHNVVLVLMTPEY